MINLLVNRQAYKPENAFTFKYSSKLKDPNFSFVLSTRFGFCNYWFHWV